MIDDRGQMAEDRGGRAETGKAALFSKKLVGSIKLVSF
jgi:hypothetical protein